MMMMKGSGRESGDGEIGRTPEQPARPRRSGAGLAGGGGFLPMQSMWKREEINRATAQFRGIAEATMHIQWELFKPQVSLLERPLFF